MVYKIEKNKKIKQNEMGKIVGTNGDISHHTVKYERLTISEFDA